MNKSRACNRQPVLVVTSTHHGFSTELATHKQKISFTTAVSYKLRGVGLNR